MALGCNAQEQYSRSVVVWTVITVIGKFSATPLQALPTLQLALLPLICHLSAPPPPYLKDGVMQTVPPYDFQQPTYPK